MTECQICAVEKIELPACPFCDEKTCVSCLKKHLTSSGAEAHCMYCKKGHLVKHLHKMVPESWLSSTKEDGYRSALKKALLEAQKARLPETVQLLTGEREQRLRKMLMNAQNKLNEERSSLEKSLIRIEKWGIDEELIKAELGIISLSRQEIKERKERGSELEG